MSNRFIHSVEFQDLPRRQRIEALADPRIMLAEIYLSFMSPHLPRGAYDPVGLHRPLPPDWDNALMIGEKDRKIITAIMQEKEAAYVAEALEAHTQIMQLLNPNIDLAEHQLVQIPTHRRKIETLVAAIPSRKLIRHLWPEKDVREYVETVRDSVRDKKGYTPDFLSWMKELEQPPIHMCGYIYHDVIKSVTGAQEPSHYPVFSLYRFKSDQRRFLKALRLLSDRFNRHPNNMHPDWEPTLAERQEIFDKSVPLDLFGFSILYLGKDSLWKKFKRFDIFKADAVQQAISTLTNSPLEGFSIYREPRNDYSRSQAKLDRLQVIYTGRSGTPFEAMIVDLASLVRIQEWGKYAHPEKEKLEHREHHGRRFTSHQWQVLDYVKRDFKPIVLDRRL